MIDLRKIDVTAIPNEFPVTVDGESLEKMEWLTLHVYQLCMKLGLSKNELKELNYALNHFAEMTESEFTLSEHYEKMLMAKVKISVS